MSYAHLSVEQVADSHGQIALVRFNRPAKANALNYDLLEEIESVALGFRDDAETRVVVFTGAGQPFSSGADLSDPGERYRGPLVLRRRRARIGERAIRALFGMDQITIAAWNGAMHGAMLRKILPKSHVHKRKVNRKICETFIFTQHINCCQMSLSSLSVFLQTYTTQAFLQHLGFVPIFQNFTVHKLTHQTHLRFRLFPGSTSHDHIRSRSKQRLASASP